MYSRYNGMKFDQFFKYTFFRAEADYFSIFVWNLLI